MLLLNLSKCGGKATSPVYCLFFEPLLAFLPFELFSDFEPFPFPFAFFDFDDFEKRLMGDRDVLGAVEIDGLVVGNCDALGTVVIVGLVVRSCPVDGCACDVLSNTLTVFVVEVKPGLTLTIL